MKKTLLIFAITFLSSLVLVAQTAPKPTIVAITGGSFTMGGTESDEKPVHSVTVSNFSIGKYEVTVSQYKAFCIATGKSMPAAPSWGWNDKYPVVNVNYNDAVNYCNWLGEKYGGDWRLPTEAEWEYAARGGKKSAGYAYAGSDELEEVAWFYDNADGQTQSVGRKKPNELGIFDMSGNVWEWCKNWDSEPYYSSSPSQNPKGAASGTYLVSRGGSWRHTAANCRVAFRRSSDRGYRNNDGGFRVVLSQ